MAPSKNTVKRGGVKNARDVVSKEDVARAKDVSRAKYAVLQAETLNFNKIKALFSSPLKEQKPCSFVREGNRLRVELPSFSIYQQLLMCRRHTQHRPGEDKGFGDCCYYNADCMSDYPERLHIKHRGQNVCPGCLDI